MMLLIDAGNTRIKWALVNGENWLCSEVLPVAQAGSLSQHFAGCFGLAQENHVERLRKNFHDIRQVWVSNVAGEEVAQHIQAACAARQWLPQFIIAQAAQCGVHNGYAQPSQLGSDRWAALIAAWHLTGRSCLVVNSGTATTIDTISASGEFIGGLILPGVELMQRSLCAATTLSKSTQGGYVPFPLNTIDALFSGAIQATCGAIERQYALLDDGSAPIVLSGGAAAQFIARIKRPVQMVDNLVLQGLLLIAQEESA